MKSKFLFPTWGSWLGYLLAIPGFILGYLYIFKGYNIPGFGFKKGGDQSFFSISPGENFTNELAIFLVVIGLLLIAFSKNKREDELNAKIRLDALYWSIMIYYLLYFVIMCLNTIGIEIPFIEAHGQELNIFTPLVIFIIRFYFLKYLKKESYLIHKIRLLPYKPFKKVGMVLSLVCLPVFVTLYVSYLFGMDENWSIDIEGIMIRAAYLGLIIGLLLWAFSQNKIEDERAMQQRLESLQLTVYVNYAILLIGTLLIYSLGFLFFLGFAQFSLLLFYVIRMGYVNYKDNKVLTTSEGGLSHEK